MDKIIIVSCLIVGLVCAYVLGVWIAYRAGRLSAFRDIKARLAADPIYIKHLSAEIVALRVNDLLQEEALEDDK